MSTPSESALAKRASRGLNRAAVVDANFIELVQGPLEGLAPAERRRPAPHEPLAPGSRLTAGEFLEVFRCQFLCRATDPAFLHYRSGGFMMARLGKSPDCDPVYETCLSLAASSEDPVSGGRHKVWGSDRSLWVLPQTSTIASHLPKAVGTAIGLEQAIRLRRPLPVPADSIVICSFGDASSNHATALAGFNAAQWAAYQRLPVPVLFVCEDNGIGISVRTPAGWVESNFSRREGLDYFAADGTALPETFEIAARAIEHCRKRRRPTFLHLKVPRLLGHAGTDWEGDYMEMAAIEANEARDPLLAAARLAAAHYGGRRHRAARAAGCGRRARRGRAPGGPGGPARELG